MKITDIKALEIIDNRGNPTIRTYVIANNLYIGVADVPSGSSTGSFEAVELRDGASRYNGNGVQKAIDNIYNIIKPALIGKDVTNQRLLDMALIGLDGTDNKSSLGANAILGVSLAAAKSAAQVCRLPLYRYLNSGAHVLPVPQACLINGGIHAGNNLDIQEYCVMPVGAETFTHAVQMLCEIFAELRDILLTDLGKTATNSSEDGGFAPPLESSVQAMAYLTQAARQSGYEKDVVFGLDLAACGLYSAETKTYTFEGKVFTTHQMIEYIKKLIQEYPGIVSIEDPLDENDDQGWIDITRELGEIMIVGDDVFATNKGRIKRGVDNQMANAMLCKVNQIGTVSEAFDAADLAKRNRYPVVMSVRSGETEDSVLSDISVAMNAGLFKTGGIRGSERGTNYNRFMEIENELGELAHFAGNDYRCLG